EALRLEDRLEQLGKMIKSKIKSSHERFVEGFAITSILYGVGAMAIVGSIQEGINGDPSVLYAKALLDGFTAIAFGAAYGLGVVFSSIPILLYQGGITLLAAQFKMTASPLLMNQISAVGGVLVMGIGLTILDIKKIRLANLLPSLLIITLLTLYLK
ncbi:MAG: DUF554 domain-containing protein, partial [Deltaproteobacteria bacterium]|nr:DUF554 domain-containing protein [Deltaproteobacteria bacterium]